MENKNLLNIGVVGSGTMGAGIAQVCSMAGHKVILYDLSTDALSKAKISIKNNLEAGIKRGKVSQNQLAMTLANISYTTELNDLKVNIAIEAIIEKLNPKVQVFNDLNRINNGDCILATNTSSIPITHISAQLDKPENLVGVHFFNPAHIMKLVEVVSGAHTSEKIAIQAYNFVLGLGKSAINAKDAPGFIVNRVARHFYVESLKVLEENVVDVKGLDALMRSSGFRLGPFQLMDLIGVETNLSVTTSMFELFNQDSKFRPSRIQQQLAAAGHYGKKTGKGFYNYE